MKAIFAVMNTTYAEVIQVCAGFEPWPLQYQYYGLPTELTSQLRAGHYVGSK